MQDLFDALNGYCLTTAEIIYHLPDHPCVLQSYIWQEFDLPPNYPRLKDFLKFWSISIEGKIHSVRVTHGKFLNSSQILSPGFDATIH